MKRIAGVLMAVLFALTLTSQTILASQYDILDPRYNGAANIVAETEGEPWVEYKNNPNDDDEIMMQILDGVIVIFKNLLTNNIYTPPVIIIYNETQNKNDGNEKEPGSQEVRQGSTPPSNM